VRHSDTLGGTLGEMIAAAEEYLWEHTQHGFDATQGPQRRRVDQYPRTPSSGPYRKLDCRSRRYWIPVARSS
jgi:hypothetical protein